MISVIKPNSFSKVAAAASSPSSGLTCSGCFSSPSMLRDDALRFKDPVEAKDASRDKARSASSFC
jgi:hypothetical protein